jgi:hypothetical protein
MKSEHWVAKYGNTPLQDQAYQRVIKLSVACGNIAEDLLLEGIESKSGLITAGAFGEVFRAKYGGKYVALKSLKPDESEKAVDQQRVTFPSVIY